MDNAENSGWPIRITNDVKSIVRFFDEENSHAFTSAYISNSTKNAAMGMDRLLMF